MGKKSANAENQIPDSGSEDLTPAGDAGSSLDDIAEQITHNMPDVNSAFIVPTGETGESQSGNTPNSASETPQDDYQRNPDGSIKVSEKTGKPLKKRGRKAGGANAGASKLGGIGGTQNSTQNGALNTAQINAHELGKASAGFLFSMGIAIGGEDFAPIVDPVTGTNEPLAMQAAFSNYYLATGKTDLPPGLMLTMVICSYAVPRFTQPKVKNRVSTIWGRAKLWLSERKKAKKAGVKNSAGVVEQKEE